MKGCLKVLVITLFSSLSCLQTRAQAGTNEANFMSLSANATAATKMATDVNLYTGLPSISFGIKVAESPSSLGLGWNLNVGGIITRTVRGMPDEFPTYGYLNAAALPADYRSNGNKYYYDSLDSQQDIFQFNFNGRSGKFFIGKNGKIVVVPLSKIQITYTASPLLNAFTIITEDGVKYVFNQTEKASSNVLGSVFTFGYQDYTYTQAWYLTKEVAPFATDSIQFFYTSLSGVTAGLKYPETIHVNSIGTITDEFNATGTRSVTGQRKISRIVFPDKKNIDFIYDPSIQFDENDSVLNKIQFSDTIFRYGFIFDRYGIYYDSTTGHGKVFQTSGTDKRAFLSGIKYYTKTATMPGYTFTYHPTFFQKVASAGDTTANKRDHWGFYKSSINNAARAIPTVTGIYTGLDRSAASISDVLASSLSGIVEPNGGQTVYGFEPNTIYPFTISPQSISVNAASATQTSISLSQVVSNQYEFRVAFGSGVSRQVSPTFSGTANLTCSITSTDGLTTYATKTLSLFQVFYTGVLSFKVSIPDGAYLFKTSISVGTTAPSGLAIVVTWDNETTAGGTGNTVGGARIATITTYKPGMDGMPVNNIRYKYLTTDGKSSGFLGLPPVYHYPITKVQTTNGGSPVTTNETAISSEPVSNLNYTQGNMVGYSRVEVVQETFMSTGKNGKTVYEFTNLKDAGANISVPHFPYAPTDKKEWKLGLPKRTLVYDSTNTLIKSTTNTYAFIDSTYESTDFQSLKLGMTVYNSNYNTGTSVLSPTTKFFSGELYYPVSGRANLVATIDTFYHPDNSIQVTGNNMEYDTNYNVIKATSSYDKTRGLFLEKRMYYCYSYTLSGAIGKLRTNRIFAPVSSEQWITGDGNPRMISAQITDFQELADGYIVPLNTYSLQSRGPVVQATIGVFDPAQLVRNSTYLIPQQKMAAYDTAGNVLEIKNPITGQSNTVLMDYFNQFPVAKVSNAKLADVAYTSFESDSKGNWTIANYVKNSTDAVTGKFCYNLTSGSISKTGLTSGTSYWITYWTMNGSPVTISGSGTSLLLATQNGWNLYSYLVTGVTSVTISGSGLIDELRLHPKDANMITTTYEPFVGPTSVCDANNTIMYNEYDALNRLVIVRDKDKNIIKKNEFSNTVFISTDTNWVANDEERCHDPLNGDVERAEVDNNIYSQTYNNKRWVYDHGNSVSCQPVCTDPDRKLVDGICEIGTKTYTSSVYQKVCDTEFNCAFKWVCTYHYYWSDLSESIDYIEYSTSQCFDIIDP